jgi:hypothetical protein
MSNLVSFVVILRIVLEDLRLLLVIKIANELIEYEFLPPLLTFNEPSWKTSVSLKSLEIGSHMLVINVHFL